MRGDAKAASTVGRGRNSLLGGILIAVIALYAVYAYALYLVVSAVF
jgi:hypothetical protein